MAYRNVKTIIAFPLFILLHILFTLSSFLLRLTQSFHNPHPPSPAPAPASVTDVDKEVDPPKHVALSFPSSIRRRVGGIGSNRPRLRESERRALIESLRRVAQWAAEEGVEEVSAYSDLGWSSIRSELDQIFVGLTHQSRTGTQTPPDTLPSAEIRLVGDDDADTDTVPRKSGMTHRNGDHQKAKGRNGARALHEAMQKRKQLIERNEAATSSPKTITYTLHPFSKVTLHLLPSLDLALLAIHYAKTGTPPSQISVARLDADIRASLGVQEDPDILIIHPLTPLNPLRALLARPAPELAGYPFWLLRVTEIYHHPTPLPLLPLLSPIVQSLRTSSLPALQKIGHALPLVSWERVRGAIRREEWDGAMAALGLVEQRLGR